MSTSVLSLVGAAVATACGMSRTDLCLRDGMVSFGAAREGEAIDCTGCWIVPGFMELHFHGAAGHRTLDLSRDAYRAMAKFLASRGVTSFLMAVSACAFDKTLECVDFAAATMAEGLPGARLAGVYMEGPCLKNAGGMKPELLRVPDPEELEELLEHGRGIIKIMTLAPEMPGAMELVERLVAQCVVPAAGHSSASAAELREAVRRGLRHVTHLGNNGEGDIRCVKGRYQHDGPLLEMLDNDQLTAEIIADGVHVAPQLVKLFCRAKGVANCAAITDGCAASGLEDGNCFFPNPLGQLEEFTVKGGALYVAGTGQLTGSLLTMNKAFMNVQRFAGLTPAEAARCCGSTPRRIAKLEPQEIVSGKKANLVIISKEGVVKLTVADGKIIYRKNEKGNE